jgi:hypothetical protein
MSGVKPQSRLMPNVPSKWTWIPFDPHAFNAHSLIGDIYNYTKEIGEMSEDKTSKYETSVDESSLDELT